MRDVSMDTWPSSRWDSKIDPSDFASSPLALSNSSCLRWCSRASRLRLEWTVKVLAAGSVNDGLGLGAARRARLDGDRGVMMSGRESTSPNLSATMI